MFTQHFGLKFNPFVKEIEDKNLFSSRETNELESRLNVIKSTRGFFLLTAEPGTGKTATLRKFSQSLNPNTHKVCYVALSTLTVMDFYRSLVISLDDEPSSRKISLFKQIQKLINNHFHEHRITPVFIIDKAHALSSKVLEDIQMLFNFKMDSLNPFILIFSGHSLLRNKLHQAVYLSLKQRITDNFHMGGIRKDELPEYITSRLTIAGAADTNIFSTTAVKSLFEQTKGTPRTLNNLITASLTCAAALKKNIVDEEIILQASRDIEI